MSKRGLHQVLLIQCGGFHVFRVAARGLGSHRTGLLKAGKVETVPESPIIYGHGA